MIIVVTYFWVPTQKKKWGKRKKIKKELSKEKQNQKIYISEKKNIDAPRKWPKIGWGSSKNTKTEILQYIFYWWMPY